MQLHKRLEVRRAERRIQDAKQRKIDEARKLEEERFDIIKQEFGLDARGIREALLERAAIHSDFNLDASDVRAVLEANEAIRSEFNLDASEVHAVLIAHEAIRSEFNLDASDVYDVLVQHREHGDEFNSWMAAGGPTAKLAAATCDAGETLLRSSSPLAILGLLKFPFSSLAFNPHRKA